MNVLIFHPTILPPKDYGGVERVVIWLAKGLLERGHRVTLAAHSASQKEKLPKGIEFLPIDPHQSSCKDLLKILPKGIDLVHFMAPPQSSTLAQLPCAYVLTVHGNGREGEVFPENSIFLTQNHARRHRGKVYVYNGIDPEELLYCPREKDSWFLFLSKTNWSVKNLKGAIRFALASGQRLRISGGSLPLFPRMRSFFDPRLSWEGPVAGQRKAELLARSKALLFPVIWPEPFGLVVVEALMSGTPVLSSKRGGLEELIPPECGMVLDPWDIESWVKALQSQVARWKPEDCRSWAVQKFHYREMASSYEKLYGDVISGVKLHQHNPISEGWKVG